MATNDAIGYLRITQDPTDERAGVTRQREDVIKLADRLGRNLVAIFVDNDVTAVKTRRADTDWAKGVLAHLRDHPDDWLLGTSHDRIGRRLGDLESLHDHQLEHPPFKVWTVSDADLFASEAWPYLAAQAKVEAMATRRRVIRQKESRRAKGLDGSLGVRPFGFEKNRLTPVVEEREAFREAVRRALEGESASSIAADFNRRGIHRTGGGTWRAGSLRRMLLSPRYVGDLTHKGVVVKEGGAAWKPFIDRETYDRLRSMLARTARPQAGGRPSTSLLGGIARCGRCGVAMTAAKTAPHGRLVYRCSQNLGGCGRVSRSREAVDQFVTERLLRMLDTNTATPGASRMLRPRTKKTGWILPPTSRSSAGFGRRPAPCARP
ncbi:recombinase family protein [Streptomyces sp. NPDC057430]|uniref:recombinase family protein n=1 Tax=Streptomyces sp. NPDC057430 TaxID=3346131 RepID=UPI00369EB0FD